MNTRYKKQLSFFAAAFALLFAVRCGGGNDNSVRMVVNGQTYEMALQNSQCQATQPSGVGLYNLPVICTAGFINTGGLADSVVVNVTDARAIEDQLGVFIPLSPSLLIMNITLDGNQLALTDGGATFTEISNISGGRTCFDFEANSAQVHIEGNMCANNTVGF